MSTKRVKEEERKNRGRRKRDYRNQKTFSKLQKTLKTKFHRERRRRRRGFSFFNSLSLSETLTSFTNFFPHTSSFRQPAPEVAYDSSPANTPFNKFS